MTFGNASTFWNTQHGMATMNATEPTVSYGVAYQAIAEPSAVLAQCHPGDIARWAAHCAERALAIFEAHHPDDRRPRRAIEAARAWAEQGMALEVLHDAAFAAHGAAREAQHPRAAAAARAAGHAAAVAHAASHAMNAAAYALVAIAADREDMRREGVHQLAQAVAIKAGAGR